MFSISRARWALVLALLGSLLATATARAQNLPTGFAWQPVVGPPFDSFPVGFTFLPDGRILILEKISAEVRLATVGSSTSVVIATIPGIVSDGERGLLGVAVDPAWPQRPYIYLMGTYSDARSRVTMYTASGDLTQPSSTNLTLGSPFVLIDDIPNLYAYHKGGTLRFGPDGMLYVSLGDDSSVCEVQSPSLFNGKMLRLRVDTMPQPGSGPPPKTQITPVGNPFSGPTDNARLVYALGLRNPFRFTIDPVTGNLYMGDVGNATWEELNEIVRIGYHGSNFGWPFREGSYLVGCCCDSFPPYIEPIYYYANPPGPAPAAVIQGPLYRRVPGSPLSFPYEYSGSLFMADYYDGGIRRLVKTNDTWQLAPAVAGQPDATFWATGISTISDFQTGPDGALYLLLLASNNGLSEGLNRIVNTVPVDVAWETNRNVTRAVPNPALVAHGVTIHYQLAPPRSASVRIYDAAGHLVRTLRPASPLPGALFWDGRNNEGTPVAPGLYIDDVDGPLGVHARGKVSFVR